MDSLSTQIRRLRAVRAAAVRFPAHTPSQRQLQGLLLAMLRQVEANHCRPGRHHAAERERWWLAIEVYWRLFQSPRLAARGGRKLARRLMAMPWYKLEKPVTVRRLLGPDAEVPLPLQETLDSRAA